FHPSPGWRGCSLASVFPCDVQAAKWLNDSPAKQYACADNAGATRAMPRRQSIGLMRFPLLVFLHRPTEMSARKKGPNFGLGLFGFGAGAGIISSPYLFDLKRNSMSLFDVMD